MNYEEYNLRIEHEVSSLSQKERVALCLICCFRLAPLCFKFSEVEDWGDESILVECCNEAINWLNAVDVDSNRLSKQLAEVVPDTEDFGSSLGSYALNAGVAHEYLLDLLNENNASFLIYVLRSCYDTIDFYVQECLDPDCKGGIPESEVENHEAMVNEVNWQFNVFKKVKESQDLMGLFKGKDIEPLLSIA